MAAAEVPEGWTLKGSARVVDGWVRLIPDKSWQVGAAVHNAERLSTERITAEFELAVHGGQLSDGIAIYLIDGKAAASADAWGGALGYADFHGDADRKKPGVNNGYVGIGLDWYGSFSSPDHAGTGGPGSQPNHAVIRGAGNAGTGFPYLTAAPMPRLDMPRSDPARILVSVHNRKVTVRRHHRTTGWTTLIDGYLLPDGTVPQTLRLGISGSSGQLCANQEIRSLAFIPTGRRIRADFAVKPAESERLRLEFFRKGEVDAKLTSGDPAQDFGVMTDVPVQVIVQQVEWPHEVVGNGSAYFRYDPQNDQILIDPKAGELPKELTFNNPGPNRYEFLWTKG